LPPADFGREAPPRPVPPVPTAPLRPRRPAAQPRPLPPVPTPGAGQDIRNHRDTVSIAGTMGAPVGRWLELDFPEGIREEQPWHASILRDLAADLSREASRGRRLRVVVEGGGNGSRFRDNDYRAERAGRAGQERAANVASSLRFELGQLSAQIDVETRSRGNGPSALPARGEPLTRKQRRSVLVWVEDEDHAMDTARPDQTQQPESHPQSSIAPVNFGQEAPSRPLPPIPALSSIRPAEFGPQEAAPTQQATDRTRDLRDLLDGGELDLLQQEVTGADPAVTEHIERLADQLADAFRQDLEHAPAGVDVSLTLTAHIADQATAYILAASAAPRLRHQIVLQVAGLPTAHLCP
jgi:hypothetical protein